MESINEPVAKRFMIHSKKDITDAIDSIGFPMILRNGFALGGLGSCFINNKKELDSKITELLLYPDKIMVEQSIKGWKEVEYEIVRDYMEIVYLFVIWKILIQLEYTLEIVL